MGNVLDPSKQQQVLALGRLGWTLRRIERETGVRRETVSAYLRAAGVVVRGRGRPGEEKTKPAISEEVSTDPAAPPWPPPGRAPCASACEPYRELIVEALGRGRNAMAIWQDLVDDHGFFARYASVRRFVLKLRGAAPAEARVVITTAPAKKARSTTGMAVRWSATGVPGSTDPRGSSS
jgi:transposase